MEVYIILPERAFLKKNQQKSHTRLEPVGGSVGPSTLDFCSIFDPNLPPKIHPNRSKIDAKMPSHVELLF